MNDLEYYNRSNRNDSIYDKIKEELDKHFQIRFNEIALEYEIIDKLTGKSIEFNESSLLIHLQREKLNVNPQIFKTYLKSHFVDRFNPLTEYFEKLPKWNNIDYIEKFASYVRTDDNLLFTIHLKKWAVRAVKTIFLKDQINKHCLVLANGSQNAGKSTYLAYLCPPKLINYYYENLGVSKDDRIKLCKAFIINIEELDIMGKYDVNSIKSIISQRSVNERLPYADKATLLYRTCSFVASTNRLEFLNDDTGSVRWIVFDLLAQIDFSYSKEFDIDLFWSQAYHIFKYEKDFKSDLSHDEVQQNELRNERFTIQTVENEFVLKYYDVSLDTEDFVTATDIVTQLNIMGHKLNPQKIGAALKKYGFQRIKHSKRQVYGYLAKPKFKDSPWGFQ